MRKSILPKPASISLTSSQGVARDAGKAVAVAARVASVKYHTVSAPDSAAEALFNWALPAAEDAGGGNARLQMHQALDADSYWLEGNLDRNLIEQPMWLIDVRGNKKFHANFPAWVREPFDRFVEEAKGTDWEFWTQWYRSILPNNSRHILKDFPSEADSAQVARMGRKFWENNPDTVMLEMALGQWPNLRSLSR